MTNITQEQVDAILAMKSAGRKNISIAKELGVSSKRVSEVLLAHGIRSRAPRKSAKKATLKCPKCKRGGFPKEYMFCPYCSEDIRTEKDKLLDLLHRTDALFSPPFLIERDSKASYAIRRAIAYLGGLKDE